MAEDGAWPAIRTRGLLSTRALVDLYDPPAEERAAILNTVRRTNVVLTDPALGPAVIRDQAPLKFLDRCLIPGTSPQQYLDALNGRVFFWLTSERLLRLLNAPRHRKRPQTVLQVDTAALLSRYGHEAELAPFNTGSMQVPSSPARGADVFVDIDTYPYDLWRSRRGRRHDAVVELTVRHSIPDIAEMTIRVERWSSGHPINLLFHSEKPPGDPITRPDPKPTPHARPSTLRRARTWVCQRNPRLV